MTAKCDNPECVGGRVPCPYYKEVNPGLTIMTCPDECPPGDEGPPCTVDCPTCNPDAEGEMTMTDKPKCETCGMPLSSTNDGRYQWCEYCSVMGKEYGPTCKPDAEGDHGMMDTPTNNPELTGKRVKCPQRDACDKGQHPSCPTGFDLHKRDGYFDCTVPAHPDAPGDEDITQNMDHLARILCVIDEERQRGTLKDATELLAAVDAYDDWMEPRLPEPHDADTAPVEDGTVPWEFDAPGDEGGGGEHSCPVCVGNPISGKPCICGGTGNVQDAYTNLLRQHYDLETALAAERKRADELESQLSASNARLEGVREWAEREWDAHDTIQDPDGRAIFARLLGKLDTPQLARPGDGVCRKCGAPAYSHEKHWWACTRCGAILLKECRKDRRDQA